MTDKKEPTDKFEPSEKTKALLERAAAAKEGKTATIIEDANTDKAKAEIEEKAAKRKAEIDDSKNDLKAKTRTMSRTEAEQERGRQIVARNEEARRRAQRLSKASED